MSSVSGSSSSPPFVPSHLSDAESVSSAADLEHEEPSSQERVEKGSLFEQLKKVNDCVRSAPGTMKAVVRKRKDSATGDPAVDSETKKTPVEEIVIDLAGSKVTFDPVARLSSINATVSKAEDVKVEAPYLRKLSSDEQGNQYFCADNAQVPKKLFIINAQGKMLSIDIDVEFDSFEITNANAQLNIVDCHPTDEGFFLVTGSTISVWTFDEEGNPALVKKQIFPYFDDNPGYGWHSAPWTKIHSSAVSYNMLYLNVESGDFVTHKRQLCFERYSISDEEIVLEKLPKPEKFSGSKLLCIQGQIWLLNDKSIVSRAFTSRPIVSKAGESINTADLSSEIHRASVSEVISSGGQPLVINERYIAIRAVSSNNFDNDAIFLRDLKDRGESLIIEYPRSASIKLSVFGDILLATSTSPSSSEKRTVMTNLETMEDVTEQLEFLKEFKKGSELLAISDIGKDALRVFVQGEDLRDSTALEIPEAYDVSLTEGEQGTGPDRGENAGSLPRHRYRAKTPSQAAAPPSSNQEEEVSTSQQVDEQVPNPVLQPSSSNQDEEVSPALPSNITPVSPISSKGKTVGKIAVIAGVIFLLLSSAGIATLFVLQPGMVIYAGGGLVLTLPNVIVLSTGVPLSLAAIAIGSVLWIRGRSKKQSNTDRRK